jgi:hypothetical protein
MAGVANRQTRRSQWWKANTATVTRQPHPAIGPGSRYGAFTSGSPFYAPTRLAGPSRLYNRFSSAISQSSDDARQAADDTVSITSSLLATAADILFGFRFQGVAIPPGATIVNATLWLTIQIDKNDAEGIWHCEDVDDAATFTETSNNIGGRAATTATVAWTTNDLGGTGARIPTPNLSACVQEVVDRAGWVSGNDLVFVYSHTSTDALQVASFDDLEPEASLVIDWLPPALPSIFSDDFNRADSTSLGADWTEVAGNWTIASNQLCLPGIEVGGARYNVDLGSNDHWAEAELTTYPSSLCQIGICLRLSTAAEFTGYSVEFADGFAKLIRVTAGSPSTHGTVGPAHTPAVGDVIAADVSGTTVRLFLDGVEFMSWTDATFATPARSGLHLNTEDGGSGACWDNFRTGAGAYPGLAEEGGTDAPAGHATATGTAFDPTVTLIANAPAGHATATGTAFNPTLTLAANAPAEHATATGVANAPTLTLAANAPAELAAATGTAFDPTVNAVSNTNAPAELAAATGVAFDATVSTTGGTSAPADHATAIGTAFDPTLTLAANAPAGHAAATGTAFDPTVTLTANALPGHATATGQAFDPTAALAANAPAGHASATGAAFDATVSTATITNAPAEIATATGTAFNPTTTGSSAANAGHATTTGQAFAAAADIGASGGTATATGTAFNPTIQTSVFALAGHAAATGQAFDIAVAPPVPVPPVLTLTATADNRGLTAIPDNRGLTAIPDELILTVTADNRGLTAIPDELTLTAVTQE